jgi:hypothetical protein
MKLLPNYLRAPTDETSFPVSAHRSTNVVLPLLIWFSIVIFVFVDIALAVAQHDSTYFKSMEDQITGRLYLSRKYTTFAFRSPAVENTLRYRSNTTLNLGIGATYKFATLNLAYGFDFLNPDRGRGDTRYLDLQLHSYGRKFTIDALGQFYKGFYLAASGRYPAKPYYLRPDLAVTVVGGIVQYVFNHRRFSYRAPFMQNEWQEKSAGTFLLGAELVSGGVSADSSFIPSAFSPAASSINRMRFIEVGANAGYAYSLVIKRHFFLTAAGAVGLNAGVNRVYFFRERTWSADLRPNTLLRAAIGYNSALWMANVLWVSHALRLASDSAVRNVNVQAGNVRIVIVYRFRATEKMKRSLRPLDKTDKEMKEEIDD